MSLTSSLNRQCVLLANSGIQFADFPLPSGLKDHDRYFVRETANGPLIRVHQSGRPGRFILPARDNSSEEIVRPEYQARLKNSLRHFHHVWLPLPFFRTPAPGLLAQGPANWVRGFITLNDEAATDIGTLTLAFDTTPGEDPSLQPHHRDYDNRRHFGLCWQDKDIAGFIRQRWLDNWLREIFTDSTGLRADAPSSFDKHNPRDFTHQAHYLNVLELFHLALGETPVVILPVQPGQHEVPVDLILDVGNQRSCGVLSEEHPGENNGLQYCRELQIRHLSAPSRVNNGLFSSETAFSASPFDPGGFSAASGRADAFCWPSTVRTGGEARQLTRPLHYGDGRQGVSNPCHALRDPHPLQNGWDYPHHQPFSGKAILSPFTCLLNDQAELLSSLPPGTRFPVTEASFPPASLLMFQLCELLSHAFSQINSVQHRRQMPDSTRFRRLRNLTLILPGTTTAIEKAKAERLAHQAVELIRQQRAASPPGAKAENDPGPVEIHVCDQGGGEFLWLYQQLSQAGDPRQPCAGLIQQWQRQASASTVPEIRIAVLDCGAGSLDVSVTGYQLAGKNGPALRSLQPAHTYRALYDVAGESLLIDITRHFLFPALARFLRQSGVERPAAIIRQLFLPGVSCEGDNGWRRQFVAQFLRPLAVAVLESCHPAEPRGASALPGMQGIAANFLPQHPDPQVMSYFSARVSELSAKTIHSDPSEMSLSVSMAETDAFFGSEACRLSRLLSLICDNVTKERPDIVLIVGGNAILPLLRQRLAENLSLPPERIITPGTLLLSENIPFCRDGTPGQGKYNSILSVLIQQLISRRKLLAGCFLSQTPPVINLIREVGVLTENAQLPASEVLISLPAYPEAGTTADFEVFLQQRVILGFRGTDSEAGPALPLFILQPATEELTDEELRRGLWVTLHWQADQQGQFSRLPEISRVRVSGGKILPAERVSISLCLPGSAGHPDEVSWQEDGRVPMAVTLPPDPAFSTGRKNAPD